MQKRKGEETIQDTPGPFPLRLVSWNITLRCPLKCPHCYSDSGTEEAADILSTTEAYRLLDQVRSVGRPVVILTGGEPMMREDIYDIARYGTSIGLIMAMGTSGFFITDETLPRLVSSGVRSIAISLDSRDPADHDSFRGYPGAWDRAVGAIRLCISQGIAVQVNITVVSPDTRELDETIRFGIELGVKRFQIFIPVPTGRSKEENYEKFGAYEALLIHLLTAWTGKGISLRPTCIPQFLRVADELGITNREWGRGCIAGISYCRIFADGTVTPCPYLPAIAGDARVEPFKDIWNNAEVFKALRDPDRLGGKCGACSYRAVCGGCRARAFSKTGRIANSCGSLVQPLDIEGELCGEDPLCPYIPEGLG